MKNQLMKNLWIPVVGILLVISACKKQDLVPEENANNNQMERAFGALPDDPGKVALVPLIVSRDYLARKATAKGPTKGKGGGSTGGTTSDGTAPNVSITSPAQSASVSGTVSINVAATDNVAVTAVTITLNGATVATLASAPYTFAWNTSNYAGGVYTIEATARDAAGNWSKASVSVVKNAEVVVDPPSATGFSLQTPAVSNQGQEGSCVAFAVGYASRSIDWYYSSASSAYSYSSNVFSPEYLYNQTKAATDCGSGSSVVTALQFLQNNGICSWASMPYTSGSCSTLPTSAQTLEAGNFKIRTFKAVLTSDIQGVKSLLSQKHPLILSFVVDSYFYNARAGFIWKSFSSTLLGRHAVAVVGYDDSKNAFKVMNSWGTGWGDAGYTWIDYNFFPQLATYVYGMNL